MPCRSHIAQGAGNVVIGVHVWHKKHEEGNMTRKISSDLLFWALPFHMLHVLGTSFYYFLVGTPDKCTWNLVRPLLVYWIQRVLCILYSDVFSYYYSKLKEHSQLMHMHIRYHFLADLHVTRCAWNRKWEEYPEYSKQTLKSWTIYKPKSWL